MTQAGAGNVGEAHESRDVGLGGGAGGQAPGQPGDIPSVKPQKLWC